MVHELSMVVIVCQFFGTVEHGYVTVGVAVYPDFNLDIVHAITIRRDLQFHPFEGHTIVVSDDPFILFAQDVGDILADEWYEARAMFSGRLHEFGIEGGLVDLLQVSGGIVHLRDAGGGQLLGEALLVGTEGPFRASSCLG